MIIVDEEKVMFKGTATQLMAEVTSILRGLIDKKVIDKNELNFIVDLATKSSEQLKEDLAARLLESLTNDFGANPVGDAFRQLFKAMEDEWNEEK